MVVAGVVVAGLVVAGAVVVVAVAGAAVVTGPAVVVVAGAAVVVAGPEGNWHDRDNIICFSICASKSSIYVFCTLAPKPGVSHVTNP